MRFAGSLGHDDSALGAEHDTELDRERVRANRPQLPGHGAERGLELVQRLLQRLASLSHNLAGPTRGQIQVTGEFLVPGLYQQAAAALYRDLHEIRHATPSPVCPGKLYAREVVAGRRPVLSDARPFDGGERVLRGDERVGERVDAGQLGRQVIAEVM